MGTDPPGGQRDIGPMPDMVCGVCFEPLNRMVLDARKPQDAVWNHPMNTQHDHDPVPMPKAEALEVRVICDFCTSPDVRWSYHTAGEMKQTLAVVTDDSASPTPAMTNRYSPNWAACDPCAQIIEIPDVERLITRLRRADEAFARVPRKLLRDHLSQFLEEKVGRDPYAPVSDTPDET